MMINNNLIIYEFIIIKNKKYIYLKLNKNF